MVVSINRIISVIYLDIINKIILSLFLNLFLTWSGKYNILTLKTPDIKTSDTTIFRGLSLSSEQAVIGLYFIDLSVIKCQYTST